MSGAAALEHDADPAINFSTRKWVRPEDLNAHGTLFGGSLLRWIDDEAVVYAAILLGTLDVVTEHGRTTSTRGRERLRHA